MTTKAATPSTPKELEDWLKDKCRTAEAANALVASGEFATVIADYAQAYAESTNKTMVDLRGQITEQVSASVLEMFKNNGTPVTNRLNQSVAAKLGGKANPTAVGAGLNGKYTSPTDFFQNALRPANGMTPENRARREELMNYSSNTGEGGGFLIPEEWRAEIFAGPAVESAVVRPRATVIPMGSKSLHFPAVDFSTEVGEVFGGMVFYWMDEGGAIPDTNAAVAQVEFNANRLAGAAVVPNDTLKDAGALQAWLESTLPVGIRDFEDRAFLKGDGVKKPIGALTNHPAMVVAGDEAGQSSGITWNNVLAMFARALPESYDNMVWIITPDAIPEIFTMALPVGTGGSAVMIAPGAGSAAPTMTLLGRPIIWSRKAPATLNTQGDISLVDFRYYGVGDRQDVRLESSEHAQFLQDNTVFKVIERIDGQPLLLSPLTPENGGPTLSAFVQLETRNLD